MKYWELIAVLFGATGFWKLLEVLIQAWNNRSKEAAEISNLQAKAESQIVGNWIQWSQLLDKRVKELEAVADENKELRKLIENQRSRIVELEGKVERVEKENEALHRQLSRLQETPKDHA